MGKKKKPTDIDRVDDYLSEREPDVETEYGKPYDELDPEEQKQVILDIFFNGIPDYEDSAEQLRDGINYYRATGESEVTVRTITRRGHTYRVVCDKETGRFRQWVRED